VATILNDNELKKLLGTVITNGDPSSIRPNSYVLRLGDEGEFLNATKEFTFGKTKKGIQGLKEFLSAIDFPVKPYGGLKRVLTPEEHVLWLCQNHYNEFTQRA